MDLIEALRTTGTVREFTDDKSREAPAACVATLALLHGVLFDVCRAGMCN